MISFFAFAILQRTKSNPTRTSGTPKKSAKAPCQRRADSNSSSTPTKTSARGPAVCEHETIECYQEVVEGSYFQTSYLESTPNWPDTCAGEDCKHRTFGTEYKVGTRNPVYCCANAKLILHECKHAYCKPCFDHVQATTKPSSRLSARKRRRPAKLADD